MLQKSIISKIDSFLDVCMSAINEIGSTIFKYKSAISFT